MKWQDYIERRADVMMGKPVFKGTRITVELVLERLAGGAPEGDVLAAYPRLTTEHVRAAMAYAAAVLGAEDFIDAA